MFDLLQKVRPHYVSVQKRSAGFTIVERLIVIAIMSIISATVLMLLSSVHERGRDTTRITQVQEFIEAFELYYTNMNMYPNDGIAGSGQSPVPLSAVESDITVSGYLSHIPSDPLFDDPNGYRYCSSDTGDSYAILVHTESANDTEYCVVSSGPEAYTNNLCSDIAALDRCADRF